jgi:hypothetical protein
MVFKVIRIQDETSYKFVPEEGPQVAVLKKVRLQLTCFKLKKEYKKIRKKKKKREKGGGIKREGEITQIKRSHVLLHLFVFLIGG